MKRMFLLAGLLLIAGANFAQLTVAGDSHEDIFVFPVTDYVSHLNDTIKVVQVFLPDGFGMQNGQVGVLTGSIKNSADSSVRVGSGKCRLIKGNYNYFTINLANRERKPQDGDLLYTSLYYPARYKGRIYDLIKAAVYIKISSGDSTYDFRKAMYLDEKSESVMITSLLNDIHFVAGEMKKQNDSQDQLISDGLFKGKRLFDAMQSATKEQLDDFLDYVLARPAMYAAHAWNISEIFATWMVGGTPRVVK